MLNRLFAPTSGFQQQFDNFEFIILNSIMEGWDAIHGSSEHIKILMKN